MSLSVLPTIFLNGRTYLPLTHWPLGDLKNIFQNVFFKLISWIDTLSNSCETALRSMPQNPSDDKSTLVQVMAWCRQAASHYLSQCCPRSLSPYGVTRPQWVKTAMKDRPKWIDFRPTPRSSLSSRVTWLPTDKTYNNDQLWYCETMRNQCALVHDLKHIAGTVTII